MSEHYDRIAVSYDVCHSKPFYKDLLRLEQEMVESLNPFSVLDVGCGTGQLMELLRKRFNVVGVDTSIEMLRVAGEKGLKVYAGDATNLEWLADNSFDVVCCFKALPHIADKKMALQQMANVSKRFVVFSYYNKRSVMRLWRMLKPKPVFTKYDEFSEIEELLPDNLRVAKVVGHMVFSPSNALYFRRLENSLPEGAKRFFGSHVIVVCEKVKE